MKEDELREHCDCSICKQKIGHAMAPFFWTASLKLHEVLLTAVNRQSGLAAFLGSSALAKALGPDEDMTKVVEEAELTICAACATPIHMLMQYKRSAGEQDDKQFQVHHYGPTTSPFSDKTDNTLCECGIGRRHHEGNLLACPNQGPYRFFKAATTTQQKAEVVKILDEGLENALEGLMDQVARYWGPRPESYEKAITCAKAMLEQSSWNKNR